jgi:hypothetical protein
MSDVEARIKYLEQVVSRLIQKDLEYDRRIGILEQEIRLFMGRFTA